jgi:S-disulfanyl-L-cysteine oxidoreductase SoxD
MLMRKMSVRRNATRRISMTTFATLLTLTWGVACAETPNLGVPIDPADIAPWDISIGPDGVGLPGGSGTPAEGAVIFAAKCTGCHGLDGKSPYAARLWGGGAITDISAQMKTIANFWPYSTTLFDFIRRAMPWTQPRSLTDNEVYALTAFILAKNNLIGEDAAMNAQTLPKVRMPNVDNFIIRFPDRI